MDEDLDALVRRADEDRWLASRFAASDLRGRLIAIYALSYELAHVAETVKTPAAGDIRLAWWRDALSEILAGNRPRAHPVLSEFALAHRHTPFAGDVLQRLIDARGRDLDPHPFASLDDIADYLDATAGAVLRLAITACGGVTSAHDAFISKAAEAWGFAGLLRAEPVWRARGRRLAPRD
ncbi:MAG: squalene/phytoene synthase family protein, partial [Phycisphaerales bacterium]|nr:squalene/phytoene synthase family protein [Hyphomonadaceae bacterium]